MSKNIESHYERLYDAVSGLRNEVNCRIEHGAESGGHLEYVQFKLDNILKQPEQTACKHDEWRKLKYPPRHCTQCGMLMWDAGD